MADNNKNNQKKEIRRFEFRINLNLKNILIWTLIFIFGFSFLLSLGSDLQKEAEISLSSALADIKEGKVKEILVEGEKLTLVYKEGDKVFITRKESGDKVSDVLKLADIDPTSINLKIKDQAFSRLWIDVLGTIFPLILMGLFFYFILRQARGAQDTIFSFGQSRARLFAKGRQNITFKDVAGVDEAKKELQEVVDFLKHPGKYRSLGARTPKGVLLVGPSGTGKCVGGETIVWTNKGLIEIAKIPSYYYVDKKTGKSFGTKVSTLKLNSTLKATEATASHWYCLGEQPTYKIKLASGFELEGTPEHPVVVLKELGKLEFKPLAKLQKGEMVAIQFGQEKFGQEQKLNEDVAYLLGILTGDGNLSIGSRVGLSIKEPELVEFYYRFVKKYFPQAKVYKKENDYLVTSWELKRFLYFSGMSFLLSFDKVVPPVIMQSPKEIVVSFLRGLFDTDASISRTRAEFEYTTVSKKLAQQVQMLLLNLGIVAILSEKGKIKHGYPRPVYRLTIRDTFLLEFSKKIGFGLERKQKLLEAHLKNGHGRRTNIDLFSGLGKIVDECWRQLSARKLSNEYWAKRVFHIRTRNRISRYLLTQFLSYLQKINFHPKEEEYLRQLLDARLFFSPLVEKVRSKAVVYDFTVPGTHAFIGNGFINHNTLLAKAVAGEAGVPFFSMAGSEFMEMLVGVGAARVRDLFNNAKRAAPSIIFIDEIDAIGRMRGFGIAGGHDEREQTLNQILVEMDGFTPNDNVIVMAATNRGDLLDPALLRPGRFDRRIVLDLPDMEARKAILAIHARGKPFAPEVEWETIAKRTVGFSGADLENMLNEAAILAAREGKKVIGMEEINEAAVKVKLGPAKKKLQSEEDKRLTAYHEAGHALVSFHLPHMDPVSRISIVARGVSLGHTLIPPSADRTHETKSHLLEQITALLGGRAAEDIVFSEMTTGAANDIEQATRIARAMVIDFGMSDLGPLNLGPQIEYSEMGRALWMEPSQLSPEMAAKVDREVKKIVDSSYQKALEILKKSRKKLDLVAQALIEKETLEQEDFEKIVGKKTPLKTAKV